MGSFTQAHRNLQIFCADFWPSKEDCEQILVEARIDSARINMSEPAIMRWLSIIRENIRKDDESMTRLVVVLMKQYPDNQELADVCSPWTSAEPADEMQAKKSSVDASIPVPPGSVLVRKFEKEPKTKQASETPSVPLVTAPDLAADADLVIPKIETLWDAMIDTNERLDQMEKRWKDLVEWRGSLFGQNEKDE